MNVRRAEKKRYGILLALIAAVILLVGLLFKPRQVTGHPSPENARADALRQDLDNLRALAQQNTLSTTSGRFSAMAKTNAAYFLPTSDGSAALVWSSDGIVLTAGQAHGPLQITSGARPVPLSPLVWGAGLPFTLYRAKNFAAAAPATLKLDDLEPGTWTVVETLGQSGPEFISGMFSGTGLTTCDGVDYDKILLNAPLDIRFVGSGLFDVEGNLIGVLAQCDHEVAALPIEQIVARIGDLGRPAQAPFARFGLIAEPSDRRFGSLLHSSAALIVTDVWSNWPAGRAGFIPGDMLLAVNDVPTTSVEQLAAALNNPPAHVRVQHASGGVATLTLEADAPLPPGELAPQLQPLTLAAVSPGLAARSHLRPGDQILMLNGRAATQKGLAPILTPGPTQPAVLTVQRGPHQFLDLVSP